MISDIFGFIFISICISFVIVLISVAYFSLRFWKKYSTEVNKYKKVFPHLFEEKKRVRKKVRSKVNAKREGNVEDAEYREVNY